METDPKKTEFIFIINLSQHFGRKRVLPMDLWDTHGEFTHIAAACTALALFCSTKIITAARSRLHIFLGDAGHRGGSCR